MQIRNEQSETKKKWDVIAVGGGPAGMSVAAETIHHDLGKPLILEKGPTHNQTILQYYPDEKRVDAAYLGQEAVCAGVLCFRDTTKKNFLEGIDLLIKQYNPEFIYNSNVDSIKKQKDGNFIVFTSDNQEFHAPYVVISIGRMGKPNRPDFYASIPAPAKVHVHFDLRKLKDPNKNILVVGGGNTAVEFALSLALHHRVTLSYRQSVFSRLNPMNLHLLEEEEKKQKIEVLRNTNVTGITEGESGSLKVQFKEIPERNVQEVVYGIGGSSPAAFLQNAGIELDNKGNPTLTQELETSVPNLFVAGELSMPPGKGSIIKSFNSGTQVVEAIQRRTK